MKTQVFYSHGKLLLTAEYIVLDGATALAVPTKKGQYLSVKTSTKPKIVWKSYDENNTVWFETVLDVSLKTSKNTNKETTTLLNILQAAKKLNPEFLNSNQGYLVTTQLTFNREFGLGSSSTLIANIAKWAKVDPFELLQQSFGGSGYDIACANNTSALLYHIKENKPSVTSVIFNPSFKNQIYFIYLNQKQDSKEGIKHYRNLHKPQKNTAIEKINSITKQLLTCNTISEFNTLITIHEAIMSDLINLPTVKNRLFSDYTHGSLKSLGAWGGDFIMVTTKTPTDLDYFKAKGYTTIFTFEDMVL